jgi:hypothetical protein
MESDFMILGDPIKNKIFIIEKSLPFYSNLYEISENREYFYSYFKQSYFNNNRLKADSISIEKLKSMGIPKGDFYLKENNESLPYLILGLLIMCILAIYFFNKKKSKRVNFQSNERNESNLVDALPQGSFEFLKEFLLYPKGHELSSEQITELMGFSNYAYETQRQVRSKLINSINNHFKVHYKMYPIIVRKNSKDDKRFVIYNISDEYFEDLKQLLIKIE